MFVWLQVGGGVWVGGGVESKYSVRIWPRLCQTIKTISRRRSDISSRQSQVQLNALVFGLGFDFKTLNLKPGLRLLCGLELVEKFGLGPSQTTKAWYTIENIKNMSAHFLYLRY